jgi:amino acid transporter
MATFPASAGTGRTAAPSAPAAPQLKKGAIGYISNIVIGVASTAPAYSLAATVGFFVLISGVGVHSPAIIIVSFIPLFFIATAYRAMNTVDPDCGTTFSWVARSMSPSLGLLIGWTVIFSDIVVNANQAFIAGDYGFQLFGLNAASNNTLDVVILGVLFIVALTWICWRGIELSARTQQFLLGFEMTLLVIFSVIALIKAYTGHHAASMDVTLGWFNPFSMGFGSLLDGLLLGVFLYWGWDTGVSVNEESENSNDGPGKSAVVSTFVLIGIYLLVTVASQAYAEPSTWPPTPTTSSPAASPKASWVRSTSCSRSRCSRQRPRQPRRRSCPRLVRRCRWAADTRSRMRSPRSIRRTSSPPGRRSGPGCSRSSGSS